MKVFLPYLTLSISFGNALGLGKSKARAAEPKEISPENPKLEEAKQWVVIPIARMQAKMNMSESSDAIEYVFDELDELIEGLPEKSQNPRRSSDPSCEDASNLSPDQDKLKIFALIIAKLSEASLAALRNHPVADAMIRIVSGS